MLNREEVKEELRKAAAWRRRDQPHVRYVFNEPDRPCDACRRLQPDGSCYVVGQITPESLAICRQNGYQDGGGRPKGGPVRHSKSTGDWATALEQSR